MAQFVLDTSELDARIIYDDLATSCTFYYELKEVVEGVSGSALATTSYN